MYSWSEDGLVYSPSHAGHSLMCSMCPCQDLSSEYCWYHYPVSVAQDCIHQVMAVAMELSQVLVQLRGGDLQVAN